MMQLNSQYLTSHYFLVVPVMEMKCKVLFNARFFPRDDYIKLGRKNLPWSHCNNYMGGKADLRQEDITLRITSASLTHCSVSTAITHIENIFACSSG